MKYDCQPETKETRKRDVVVFIVSVKIQTKLLSFLQLLWVFDLKPLF